MLRGPVVQELQYTFMRDWYFMTDEDPAELLRESYFPHLAPAGPAMIRVVNSGPAGSEMEALSDVLFMAIVSARKQILAVTPYFVPPHEIVRGLRAAAQKGVDVRLIVPRKNNHVYAGMAGRARYEELLEAGVRVFERQEPFIHAKALIIDDTLAVVGSANMDMRSFRLNYETNLLVFDDRFLNELKRIVLDDLARSEELDLAEWRRRPVCRQMLENLCYLMMPVL
jgi:cardiolipin synthase